jgi:hypothetical protein
MVSMCPYKWALYILTVWAAAYVMLEATMAWRDAHKPKDGYEPGPLRAPDEPRDRDDNSDDDEENEDEDDIAHERWRACRAQRAAMEMQASQGYGRRLLAVVGM